MVDLNTSEPEEITKEGDKGDEPEIAGILKIGTSSTLSLHNSFDILNEDGELPIGEARQAELEASHIPNASHALDPTLDCHFLSVELSENPDKKDKGYTDLVILPQTGHSEFHVDLEMEPQNTTFSSNTTVPLRSQLPCSKNGKMKGADATTVSAQFPQIGHSEPQSTTLSPHNNISLTSPVHCSMTGKLQHSDHTSAADKHALIINSDRPADCNAILTSDFPTVITPITTTDEILGPDKRPHIGQSVITNNTAACRKSEIILSKYGADDLDTDQTSDSTLEPGINAEIEGDIEDGRLFTPFMTRRQKKSNKKKHVNKLNDTVVQSTSSEHIQTRSKKGVIKSNPKYL